MASSDTDGKTWDFSRCPLTGKLSLWPRDGCAPRWIGQDTTGPVLAVMANLLNQGVRMIRLARSYQHWAEGRPVAVVGEIAAGRYDVTVAFYDGPTAYYDYPDAADVLLLPSEWASPDTFALLVRGHSMQGAGIRDGDYVVVRRQSSADNGDFVVAAGPDADLPEGYVTLKQFFWEGDHIRLQPANDSMAPIHLYPHRGQDPIQIQGKVVAVVQVEEEG